MGLVVGNRHRILKRLFLSVGGLLLCFMLFAAHVAYFSDYFTHGDSIRVLRVYHWPVLLSSILITMIVFDLALVTFGIFAFRQWRRSRHGRKS